QRWSGTLRQILPTPEVVNNVVLYTALFDVENPERELMTQMSAQVFFIIAEAKDVLTVPASALVETRPGSEEYSVEVQTSFGTEMRTVEAGVRTRIAAEIRSGLEEGETVVLQQPQARQGGGQSGPRNMRLRL